MSIRFLRVGSKKVANCWKVARIALLFTEFQMSKVCQITGKKPSSGNNRSHACNATKRRFLPNIVKKRVLDPKTGKMKKMRVAVSTLRTMDKKAR